MLHNSVTKYLLWMVSKGYAKSGISNSNKILYTFSIFVDHSKTPWDDIFTHATVLSFERKYKFRESFRVVKSFSNYLHKQNLIKQPLEKKKLELPSIYEEYLIYYKYTYKPTIQDLWYVRKTLSCLAQYLIKENTNIKNITIDKIDIFNRDFTNNYMPSTCAKIRTALRAFLKYLYLNREILKRDLSVLVVGAIQFARSKPPKFYRPHEIEKIFSILKTTTPKELRTYAIVHLAYTLGIRPKEISLLRLDDIYFKKQEIALYKRKNQTPLILPLPENTVKAVAAYVIGGRASPTRERNVFLKVVPPFDALSAGAITGLINQQIYKTGLSGSAYWLRHTYAQNLLENGASIFEIKEMLGHDRIQTTSRYIAIQTSMMREVLFNEKL